MDHVLKALDEHIAHQDWLLKCARQEIEDLRAELDKRKVREESKVQGGENNQVS
jgi:hypothetical protein